MDRRRECDDQPPPSYPPTTNPHFFRIILNDTSKDTKLRLPYKFVKNYGGELSHSACLQVRDGLEWEVKITRHDCKVWFENGWPMFANFYSLEHGHFLVFGYEGNSNFKSKFNVCIFDKTASEIQYPITVEDDDSSCEIMEDCPRGSRNPGDESLLQVSLPCKKNRRKSAGKSEINPNIQMNDDDADHEYEESDEGSEEEEEEEEEEEDEDNHINAYTVDDEDNTGSKDTDSNDEDEDEDDDSVESMDIIQPCKKSLLGSRLHNRNGKAQVGELSRTQNFLNERQALQRAEACKPLQPHFVAAINPSNMRGAYLHVPAAFGKKYLVKQPTHVMLQTVSNNGTWSVDMRYAKSASRLQAGWLPFAKSNNLSAGDACVFVLKDNDEFLFEVVFYRATQRMKTLPPAGE